MVSHLLFLDLQNIRYDFCKIWTKSDLEFLFESSLYREPTHGSF
jgi:hypothetical protein